MGNGRVNGFTAAPPATDGLGDDIAATIDARIEARVRAMMPRLGTVTSISGANAQVSVQEWDEDAGGQQFRSRTGGIALAPGDTVYMVPVGGGGEYVVAGKVINSNAERAVVGSAELQNAAVRAHHIGAGEVIASKLAQQYTTAPEVNQQITAARPGIIDAARQNMVTSNAFTDAVGNLSSAISARLTAAQVNAAIAAAPVKLHAHTWDQVFSSDNDTVTGAMRVLKAAIRCSYQHRNRSGNPCAGHIDRLNSITT